MSEAVAITLHQELLIRSLAAEAELKTVPPSRTQRITPAYGVNAFMQKKSADDPGIEFISISRRQRVADAIQAEHIGIGSVDDGRVGDQPVGDEAFPLEEIDIGVK